jgi:excisionase family DNA binding protein
MSDGTLTYLTPADIGERLQLSERSVRDLLVRGKLCRYVRVGRALRVHPDEFEAWLEAQTVSAQPSPGVLRAR